MKVRSVIVLLAIAVSVLSPLSVHMTIAHDQTFIGAFDVCHAGSLALQTGNDMPCVCQPIYGLYLPQRAEGTQILDLTRKIFPPTLQEEHPPKI